MVYAFWGYVKQFRNKSNEENWGKEYKYVLAFSADNVEDVTRKYTLQWEVVHQRRLKNKKNAINFTEIYSKI